MDSSRNSISIVDDDDIHAKKPCQKLMSECCNGIGLLTTNYSISLTVATASKVSNLCESGEIWFVIRNL